MATPPAVAAICAINPGPCDGAAATGAGGAAGGAAAGTGAGLGAGGGAGLLMAGAARPLLGMMIKVDLPFLYYVPENN